MAIDQTQSVSFDESAEETVTTIPAGATNVQVELTGDSAIDLALDAGDTEIVDWSDGQISGTNGGTTTYQGAGIDWSGYGGDSETLTITGEVPTDLALIGDAFQPGSGNISYSWETADDQDETQGGSGDTNGGSGNGGADDVDQTQDVVLDSGEEETLTTIPAGATNVQVGLTGDTALDLGLDAGDTEIVDWANGQISDSNGGTTTYQGAEIEWSGYSGDSETLTIDGEVPTDLSLIGDAFQDGTGEVTYSWDGAGEGSGSDETSSGGSEDDADENGDPGSGNEENDDDQESGETFPAGVISLNQPFDEVSSVSPIGSHDMSWEEATDFVQGNQQEWLSDGLDIANVGLGAASLAAAAAGAPVTSAALGAAGVGVGIYSVGRDEMNLGGDTDIGLAIATDGTSDAAEINGDDEATVAKGEPFSLGVTLTPGFEPDAVDQITIEREGGIPANDSVPDGIFGSNDKATIDVTDAGSRLQPGVEWLGTFVFESAGQYKISATAQSGADTDPNSVLPGGDLLLNVINADIDVVV
jgi:hypothetical protein